MALRDSHSGILWPSLAHYCSLILRIQSLISSQGPCSALSAAATLTHFLRLCRCPINVLTKLLTSVIDWRGGTDGDPARHVIQSKN